MISGEFLFSDIISLAIFCLLMVVWWEIKGKGNDE